MKKRYKKVPKYAMGIQEIAGLNNAAQGMGSYVGMAGTSADGRQTELSGLGAGALKGAGLGATIGSVIPGVGTGIGAAAGGLVGGVAGYFNAKKKNKDVGTAEEAQRLQEAQWNEQARQQEEAYKAQQQLNYSRSYYGANPSYGQMGQGIYAYGTKKLPYTNVLANGGNFTPVSSNVAKVNGASHEEGGVDLVTNGKTMAEVEGGEAIVNGQSVVSDRLKLPNGQTIAEESLRIGKDLNKNEKNLNNDSALTQNSAKRNIQKLNGELAKIVNFQESMKDSMGIQDGKMKAFGGKIPKYANGVNDFTNGDDYDTTQAYFDKARQRVPLEQRLQPNTGMSYDPNEESVVVPSNESVDGLPKYMNPDIFKEADALKKAKMGAASKAVADAGLNAAKPYAYNKYAGVGNAVGNAFGGAAPYLDNMINMKLMSQAPQVPTPTRFKAMMASAMPMKTTYNVNPQLNAANKAYAGYIKNVDDNTSNSAIGRGNKLAAFAKTLENKSNIYGEKENRENQLINQDTQNRQNVSNMNTNNMQNVENQNLAKIDRYNEQKAGRLDDNRRELSRNAQNVSNDITVGLQDRDSKRLATDQIMYDALTKRDGAAVSSLIGSDYMNKFVSNPDNYRQVDELLKNQPMYRKKFHETYGKK